MYSLALSRTYTDESNNRIFNAIVDFITGMKKQIVTRYEIIGLEKDLNEKYTNIENTLDLFIAYIQEIFQQTITEEYIYNIFKNDCEFYGYRQNLYLFSYDAYKIIIKSEDSDSKYISADINSDKAILNLAIILIGTFIDALNDIKFKDIVDSVE